MLAGVIYINCIKSMDTIRNHGILALIYSTLIGMFSFDSQSQTFQMTQGFDTVVMKVLNLTVLSKPSGNKRIESNRGTNRNILI